MNDPLVRFSIVDLVCMVVPYNEVPLFFQWAFGDLAKEKCESACLLLDQWNILHPAFPIHPEAAVIVSLKKMIELWKQSTN